VLVALVARLVLPLAVKELFAGGAHVLFRVLVAVVAFFKRRFHHISAFTFRLALETTRVVALVVERFVALGTNRFGIHDTLVGPTLPPSILI
jgi:hypothetical protein